MSGNRSYIDPTEVLNLVYDERSRKVDIGEQRDIIEYLMIFFEHIETGLEVCDESRSSFLRSDSAIFRSNLKLKAMDIFKGKLASEILDDTKSTKADYLIEEDIGPLLVDARHCDLMEALRQKFNYSIRVNDNGVC